jgi:hypothetical protein
MSVYARGADAIGAVGIGFSKVYAAIYGTVTSDTTETVSYSDGMRIARVVSADLSVEAGGDNDWYADNVVSESDGGTFQSGTLTYTLDDPFPEADALLHGRAAAVTINGVSVVPHGGEDGDRYLGTGYVRKYQCNGREIYRAIIFPKVKFQERADSANTQEDSKSWQTITETANVSRDDTADQHWCYKGANYYTTEAEAEAEVKTFLNIE